jgi:histidyl-tRNA synthetase
MTLKPSIPKGTRDFSPEVIQKRNYIFDSIKEIFTLYGYVPIETPSMEKLTTLTGKYGNEGDKLLFKILDSGNFLSDIDKNELTTLNAPQLAGKIAGKGLRYDLTVPFARYIAQHQNEITFPFKRYQIQPVWRADRPQKGRYREFYQCDADIVGSKALINELELIQMANDVFKKLNIDVTIKINSRKIISGIAEAFGHKDKTAAIASSIDKLDKAGIAKVQDELTQQGICNNAVSFITDILTNSNQNTLDTLENLFKGQSTSSETGLQGIDELNYFRKMIDTLNISNVNIDMSLARGLDYYTGIIFEIVCNDFPSSIGGGGRYDNLTEIFGLEGTSGVGISFGAERIFDVMEQLQLFPNTLVSSVKLMFVNFGNKEEAYCYALLSKLRQQGISTEIYPDKVKLKKQLNYANQKNIPFVALVGEDEMKSNTVALKNMNTGEQKKIKTDELVNTVSP